MDALRPTRPTGRFAPSPTGPLHAGSMVAALASWLDARAHGGRWLVRIEDVDMPRCIPGADEFILLQLASCGLISDDPVVWQSQRHDLYLSAMRRQLMRHQRSFPCSCSRRDIEQAWLARGQVRRDHGELVYPGTCRQGLHGKPARAQRLRCTQEDGSDLVIAWTDRRLGAMTQNVTQSIGDFVLRRADGLWAYQLAVVVDDADQGITHVVRGGDMAESTPRQIHLQRQLGVPTPTYLHTPVVMASDGHKLSKQNGAAAVDPREPLKILREAGAVLGIAARGETVADWLASAVPAWAAAFPPTLQELPTQQGAPDRPAPIG